MERAEDSLTGVTKKVSPQTRAQNRRQRQLMQKKGRQEMGLKITVTTIVTNLS